MQLYTQTSSQSVKQAIQADENTYPSNHRNDHHTTNDPKCQLSLMPRHYNQTHHQSFFQRFSDSNCNSPVLLLNPGILSYPILTTSPCILPTNPPNPDPHMIPTRGLCKWGGRLERTDVRVVWMLDSKSVEVDIVVCGREKKGG